MRFALFAVLFLASPFSASLARADDFSAAIEVGRFGVMLDQAAAIEKVSLPDAGPRDDLHDDLHGRLVATVLRFNRLSDQVCRKAALPAADCTGPFRPGWLGTREADPDALRAMIDETGEHIVTFWGDICATSPESCQIE
ncbi:MAG TPA: hypothetical protein VG889_02430 [Rhizomicrobium sp.]|nr:hypothetical protein [Rhizomicrobium sp.]